jgi:hypothetical protein
MALCRVVGDGFCWSLKHHPIQGDDEMFIEFHLIGGDWNHGIL